MEWGKDWSGKDSNWWHSLPLFLFFFFLRTRSIETNKTQQLNSIDLDYIRHARRNLFKPSHLCVNMNSITGQSVSNLVCLPLCVMEFTAFHGLCQMLHDDTHYMKCGFQLGLTTAFIFNKVSQVYQNIYIYIYINLYIYIVP